MKNASARSPAAHRARRNTRHLAIQTELCFDELSFDKQCFDKQCFDKQYSGEKAAVPVELPEKSKSVSRTQTDPLRHAQYLARQMKRRSVDAETRRATVRALCADLVQSLTG